MPLHAYSVCVVLTPKHKDARRIKFAVEVTQKTTDWHSERANFISNRDWAGASCRSSNVRNAPLATVGPKKAACRDGPIAGIELHNTVS